MLSLFAHHAEAFFKVEINGKDYPSGDGMTEHAIFAGVIITVLVFMAYGIFASVRDFRRWRKAAPATAQVKA